MLIQKWKTTARLQGGKILRGFYRGNQLRNRLDPSSVSQILKGLQKKAGIAEISGLSGHSFRVDAAVDLLEKGTPLERIMLRGGWKSETIAMRYLRSWQELGTLETDL